jgi:hypothetical protein
MEYAMNTVSEPADQHRQPNRLARRPAEPPTTELGLSQPAAMRRRLHHLGKVASLAAIRGAAYAAGSGLVTLALVWTQYR